MSSEARQRLARAVTRRREELGLSQAEVRGRGGPSAQTMTNIEKAKGSVPHGSTLRDLDSALGWPKGTAAGLLVSEPAEPGSGSLADVSNEELLQEVRRRMEGGGGSDSGTDEVEKSSGGPVRPRPKPEIAEVIERPGATQRRQRREG